MKNTCVTIKCPVCGDVLTNISRQDFKACGCGNCSLNGDIGVINYKKEMPIIVKENKMLLETKFKKATLTHQANEVNAKGLELVIQPHPDPICPINVYFEGDEDKCDVSKCNWDVETRMCTEACKIEEHDVLCPHHPDIIREGQLEECTCKEVSESLTLLGQGKTKYPTCPEEAKLETFDNKWRGIGYTVELECPEFTSLCPRTGQPDFAKISIIYIPHKKLVESKSLKLYLFSFRSTGEFHENVINRIANNLNNLMHPHIIMVRGDFYPRGGISINPVVVLPKYAHSDLRKRCFDVWYHK